MAPHVNGQHRLFGGQLMAWIDVTAAVEARRHAGCQVTTVSVDHLVFLKPVQLDEILRLDARVTWTGISSMEVRVDSYVETARGDQLVNRAYLVFVALDDQGNPQTAPAYVPRTEAEKREWQDAESRRKLRVAGRPGR